MKKCQNQALMVLAGIILIRGFASGGVNMTASLYLAPVCRELGVGLGTLSLYFSIMSVVTVLWLHGAGRLINRFPVQVLALAAAAAGIFWGWKLRCTAAGCPTWRKY